MRHSLPIIFCDWLTHTLGTFSLSSVRVNPPSLVFISHSSLSAPLLNSPLLALFSCLTLFPSLLSFPPLLSSHLSLPLLLYSHLSLPLLLLSSSHHLTSLLSSPLPSPWPLPTSSPCLSPLPSAPLNSPLLFCLNKVTVCSLPIRGSGGVYILPCR